MLCHIIIEKCRNDDVGRNLPSDFLYFVVPADSIEVNSRSNIFKSGVFLLQFPLCVLLYRIQHHDKLASSIILIVFVCMEYCYSLLAYGCMTF